MLLLIFAPTTGPPSQVDRPAQGIVARPVDAVAQVPRPGAGDTVPRPADPSVVTVSRPGSGDIVERPDAATGATPWSR